MNNEFSLVKQYMQHEEVKKAFSDALGHESTAARYIAGVLLEVGNNPELQKCSPKSIAASALRAAILRLVVDRALGRAYLVPFKGQATLVIGYKGLIELATRSGKYRYINVAPIYEGETVEEDRITGFHQIGGQRVSGKIIGYLGAFEMVTGYKKSLYMTIEEIHEHAQKYSKTYGSPSSLWKTNPKIMERKTVLRQLLQQWAFFEFNFKDDDDVLAEEFSDLPEPSEPPEIVMAEEIPPAPEEIKKLLGFD